MSETMNYGKLGLCIVGDKEWREADILRAVNAHDELVAAVKAQHEAIDNLFAMLIKRDADFFPSKSGQPWAAILQGKAALQRAEGQL